MYTAPDIASAKTPKKVGLNLENPHLVQGEEVRVSTDHNIATTKGVGVHHLCISLFSFFCLGNSGESPHKSTTEQSVFSKPQMVVPFGSSMAKPDTVFHPIDLSLSQDVFFIP